jgi:anti-sigma B factor antagonist
VDRRREDPSSVTTPYAVPPIAGVSAVDIEIEHVVEGDHDILAPIGEVDLSSYAQLRDRIGELLDQGRVHLVLDLSGTLFLDSTALAALIGGRRRAYAIGGSFAVICSNRQLLRLFALTKLDTVFGVLPTLEDWRRSVAVGEPVSAVPDPE